MVTVATSRTTIIITICVLKIFRVDMFIHQRWNESRLEVSDDIFEEGDDYVTLLPEFFDNLWQPDPYFLNSKIAGEYELCMSNVSHIW